MSNEEKDIKKGGFEKTLRRVLSFKSIKHNNNIIDAEQPTSTRETSSQPRSPSPLWSPRQPSLYEPPEKPLERRVERRDTEVPPVLIHTKETNEPKMNGDSYGARGRAHTVAIGENQDSGDYVRGSDRTAAYLLKTYFPQSKTEGVSSEEGDGKFEGLQDMLQKKLQEEAPQKEEDDSEDSEDSKKEKPKKKKKGTGRKKGMKLGNTRNLSPTLREDVNVLEPPLPKSGGAEGNPPVSPRGEGPTRQRSWSSSDSGDKSEREQYRARYSFKGQRAGDLSFEQGDIIRVIKKNSNWWDGECNGKTGIFPSNYVEPLLASSGESSSSWSESQLDEEEADGDLLFDEVEEDVGIPTGRMVKILVSGPTEKLIGVLAGKQIPEEHYIEAFLLTRRYFISSRRLYEGLIKIFNKVPGEGATAEEWDDHKKWQKTIQGRVLNVFQKWAENNFYDFVEEPQLFESLVRFVAEVCNTNPYSAKLIKALRKKKQQNRLVFPDPVEQEIERLMESVSSVGRRTDDAPAMSATPRPADPVPPQDDKSNATSATITCTQTSMTNAPAPIRTSKDGKIPFFPWSTDR